MGQGCLSPSSSFWPSCFPWRPFRSLAFFSSLLSAECGVGGHPCSFPFRVPLHLSDHLLPPGGPPSSFRPSYFPSGTPSSFRPSSFTCGGPPSSFRPSSFPWGHPFLLHTVFFPLGEPCPSSRGCSGCWGEGSTLLSGLTELPP